MALPPMKRSLTATPSKMTSLKTTRPSHSPVSSTQTTPVSTLNPTPFHSHQKNMIHKKSSEALKTFPKQKKLKQKRKPPHGFGEDACRVFEEQVEETLAHFKKIRDLEFILNVKNMSGKNVENPTKFP